MMYVQKITFRSQILYIYYVASRNKLTSSILNPMLRDIYQLNHFASPKKHIIIIESSDSTSFTLSPYVQTHVLDKTMKQHDWKGLSSSPSSSLEVLGKYNSLFPLSLSPICILAFTFIRNTCVSNFQRESFKNKIPLILFRKVFIILSLSFFQRARYNVLSLLLFVQFWTTLQFI